MNRPMPAIVRLAQKMVMVIPKAQIHKLTNISILRPSMSPTRVRPRKPATFPMYMRVMMKSSLSFSSGHLKSPNWLASEIIVGLGLMY